MDAEMLDTEATQGTLAALHQDRLRNGSRAQVLEHLRSDGEVASISQRNDAKSIPVRPWVADGDRNDARPLNMATIQVLVRVTGKAPRRAVQCEYALPHKNVTVATAGKSSRIRVDIAPGHDAPSGLLAACHGFGRQRARAQHQFAYRPEAGRTRAWTKSRYPASR